MIEYMVKGGATPPMATITREGREVAKLYADGGTMFLQAESDGRWKMDRRVRGEIRPFSMSVVPPEEPEEPILTIRNHLFYHRGKAYYLTGVPEDVRPAEHLLGKRHVSRLGTFPFSSLDDVDPETWGRLRRHRGVSVGTMESEPGEYKVTLSVELEEIGLPLAAATYLLYTSG